MSLQWAARTCVLRALCPCVRTLSVGDVGDSHWCVEAEQIEGCSDCPYLLRNSLKHSLFKKTGRNEATVLKHRLRHLDLRTLERDKIATTYSRIAGLEQVDE